MNQAEQILKRYGLQMKNPDYEADMLETVSNSNVFFELKEPNPTKRRRQLLICGFVDGTKQITIEDPETFHRVFQTDQLKNKMPKSFWELLTLNVDIDRVDDVFHFSVGSYLEVVEFVEKQLKAQDTEIQKVLKRQLLREKFCKDENPDALVDEALNLFNRVVAELEDCAQLVQLSEEIISCLWEKFGEDYEIECAYAKMLEDIKNERAN